MRLVRSARGGSGRAAGMDGIVSTSPGSGTRGGSGRGNEGLGRGKGSGGSFGSGLGIGGLCGAGGSGRGSGSARGGASSQDDDVCETIHAPVAADGDGDDGPVGGVSPVGGVDDGCACPGRTEAERRVGTSRVEREEEWGAGIGEGCATGAAGRCVG